MKSLIVFCFCEYDLINERFFGIFDRDMSLVATRTKPEPRVRPKGVQAAVYVERG